MIATDNFRAVTDYVEGVLSGETVAGELLVHSCRRYVDDLSQQGELDFPYRFNQTRAEAACDFFPTCLRHSLGSYARLEFNLLPWQRYIVWQLFGWVQVGDGCRRFRRAFISVARKNGKSTFAAGLALYMTALDVNPINRMLEGVPETYIAATQKDQADIIYKEILRMREMSPTIKRRSTERRSHPTQLNFWHNGGSIRPIATDRPKDGLNPHLVVQDEIHAYTHTHQDAYQTLQTASGFRDQPLILTTTTAGDEHSLIWAKEHNYASAIVRGEVTDDTVFAACYEIDEKDDPLDPAVWPKANPSMAAGVLKKDFLEGQARIAATSAGEKNIFTRYHTNRLVASISAAFDMDVIEKRFGALSDWIDCDAVGGGIDLGSRDDLAAFALTARFKIGETENMPIYRYECRVFSYIASSCNRDLTEKPWPDYIEAGWLRVETHPIEMLVGEVITQANDLAADSVAYDPYQAQYLAESLELAGVTCASMAQNCSQFNQPIIDLRALAADGKITFEENPLLRYCFGNAVAVTNRQNQVMLIKQKSKDKIDPVVAILMSLRRAMLAPSRAVGPLAVF